MFNTCMSSLSYILGFKLLITLNWVLFKNIYYTFNVCYKLLIYVRFFFLVGQILCQHLYMKFNCCFKSFFIIKLKSKICTLFGLPCRFSTGNQNSTITTQTFHPICQANLKTKFYSDQNTR